MTEYTAAVVGTGPDPAAPTTEGFAMGYRHAEAIVANDQCELVACADVVPENAAAFAREFDLPESAAFEDYETMLAEAEPDLVTVAVPPSIHEDIVVGCAESGIPLGVHCEKPIADTIGAARRMVDACQDADVQLTFNRQRRFGKPFTEAKRLLDDGAIGDLQRVEICWGDFMDTGAHTIDLAGKFADEATPEWVIANLDYREEDKRFGVHQENQMWAQWRYDSGVYGVMSTGAGDDFLDSAMALRGETGSIHVDVDGGPMLELQQGEEREAIDVDGENMHATGDEGEDRYGSYFHDRAIDDVVAGLDGDHPSELRGELGLQTAEVIFGGYESVRKRCRVELPADVEDNAFLDLVESGKLSPAGSDE